MNKLIHVYKPIGKTPLEMIHKLRELIPEYKNEPIGYAGRLDPLAHGVLLLMVGEATKERDTHLHLNKSYTFEVLLGVTTDTYDYLGLIKNNIYQKPKANVNLYVNSFVNSLLGKSWQQYPPFSSKTVQGKPLFQWAKEGLIADIEIPKREIDIQMFTTISIGEIGRQALEQRITTNVGLVQGDFRQQAVIDSWKAFFMNNGQSHFDTLKMQIDCSKGTYIRGLVNSLGADLGCGAIAIDILRTKVGEYTINDSLKLN